MMFKKLRGAVGLLLAGALLFTSIPASTLPNMALAAEKWEEAENPTLRDYATPSVSYYNSGQGPEKFADEDMESFWNGWGDPNLLSQDQWMMYDLGSRRAEINGMSVLFFDDNGGVLLPTAIKVEYATDAGGWQEVTRKGDWTLVKNQEKSYAFEPVTTSKIRVTMTHGKLNNNKIAVAVRDWKLLGDIPADFPKPTVVTPETPSPDLQLTDAAVYAVPSTDYVADWDRVEGINDPDFNPTASVDTRIDGDGNGLGWGNYYSAPGSVHWLQYDWGAALTTKTFQVYWHGSDTGLKIPSKVEFEYKNGNGGWQKAQIKSNKKNYSKYNQYNQITLEQPITATSIRMNMTVADGAVGSGVYRWKVYSDISDEFVVAAAANSLEIPEVREGRISSRVYDKLTLASEMINGQVLVSWKSKNTDVISDNGVITPPAGNTKVALTATCSKAGKPEVKTDKDVEFLVLSKDTTEYQMTIDRTKRGVDISQELYGVFYEDINSSADGGLSAELVKNNSFENYQNLHEVIAPEVKGDQNSWKLHWNSSNAAGFVVERTDGLNANNKNYAKITGNQTLSNHGFVGRATLDKAAMAIRKGTKYDFSMFMKADSAYAGNVKVKVVDDNGAALTNEAVVTLKKDGKWNKVSASLTGTTEKLGTLVLTFEGAGATDAMYIDMVSLIPTDGYGYGNKNYSYGAGLRKDLVEKLQQLKPGFIRFPGGCVVEGSYGTDGYYNWEDSVGPLEERRAIGSYWGSPWKSVNYGTAQDKYGYMMSYQFGYHEILTLCEDLGAQAFPILSAGIFCQFTDTAGVSLKGEQLKPFADHATHLIDYCWGDPNSTDETQAYWAKKRVANGHAAPFDLNYLGIGNENWDDPNKGISYQDNFKWIKNYVENYVKEHYRERKITLISSTGPYYQGSQDTPAWTWLNRDMSGETLVDEHYYINYGGDASNTLLNSDYIYDSYKRLDEGGSNVFVGEYAGHLTSTKENVLDTAISEAAYMTGLERNGDIVRHASYAPLFEREGCRDWDYNLIKFDAYNSYGTPSYYVQTMYSNNYGKRIINTTLQKYDAGNGETTSYDEKRGHQTDLYYVTSEDDNYLYTKLVNHADYPKEITLDYPGIKDGAKIELITLSGNAMDMNTMAEPTKIAPVTTNRILSGASMTYQVPAMSLTVVKVEHALKAPTVDTVAKPETVAALTNSVNAAAKNYKKGSYTAASWSAFEKALKAAQTVLSDKAATQAQVDAAKKDLENAIRALKAFTVTKKKATIGLKESFSVKSSGCTYTTSAPKIVKITNAKTGQVKGLKTGKAIVKATNNVTGKITEYTITVKKAPKKISKVTLNKKAIKNKKATLKKGKSATLKVTLPKGTASCKITYASSKRKIATVDAKGKIKAKKKGKTTITVKTFNKKKMTFTLTVK